ncbi:hypothetical protein [Longimicrobium terrae]|uniref:Uncharacterized protein n=1 Tax=Longimicrobium terrae TaxID=1639882 RepID=A0A841GVU1_9BACT|nr:hypothetical protein [Longimicrobium terrae]MBB4635169.1 hypothetical protein [Longimicrobium terrae]MBB6069563.1 hypothetical protein [Longimicrobium terrae]NNC31634.1 hypothetical protein [Longimicrobium terrae]
MLAIALPFSARDGHAQAADTARITRAVREICPGAQIRVSLHDGERMEGRCGAVTDARLLVRTPQGNAQIPLSGVKTLWVQRSYPTEATVLLAAAGAGIGFLVTPERSSAECIAKGNCSNRRDRIISGTTGAFVGALAGRFVGPRILSWVRLAP